MALNIRLSVTKQRDRQILEAGAQADGIITNYYARPLILQDRLKKFSRDQLKALRVAQPDTLIDPIDPAILMGQPQGPGSMAPLPGEAAAQPTPGQLM
jgi:hypothetical protein